MRERLIELLDDYMGNEFLKNDGLADFLIDNDVSIFKHGYWELKPSGHYLHVGSFCSVCGKKSGIGGIRENQLKPYCPNCGAKMDLKKERRVIK